MDYVVRVEQLASRPLAVVRRCAKPHELSKVVPEACGTVWNVVRAQQIPGAGRHVAVYLDGVINLEVGVELDAPFAGHGEVVGSATPGRARGHDDPLRAVWSPRRGTRGDPAVVRGQRVHTGGSAVGDLRPLDGRMEP